MTAEGEPAEGRTRGLFVTGTDTEVGKTYVTALIARELRSAGHAVGAYKPACSGAETGADGEPFWPDVDVLHEAIGRGGPKERVCPQRFRAPLAPPVAARDEGRTVDADELRSGCTWWLGRVDVLLVEGVGGLLCPVTDAETIADLAADAGFPLLIVARAGLGTINHTLLTVEVARRRGLDVAGIVLNDVAGHVDEATADANAEEIARHLRDAVPVLGCVSHRSGDLRRGAGAFTIDWSTLARRRRA